MPHDIGTIATAVGVVLTAAGVLLALLSLRAARLQRRRQFEMIYVQRYWTLMDGLTVDALAGRRTSCLQPQDEKVALAYIRLCEDQLELRHAGWISDETWKIWSSGLQAQLTRRWPFNEVWGNVREVNEQLGEHGELTLLIKYTRDPQDPYLALPRLIRFWRAITPSP